MIDIADPATREAFIIELAKLRERRKKAPQKLGGCWCMGNRPGEPMCKCFMDALRGDIADAIANMARP